MAPAILPGPGYRRKEKTVYTRSILPVSLLSTNYVSSATSTAVPTAVDMANYFPVGRREVLFVVFAAQGTTTLGCVQTVTIEECASTATASFTSVMNLAGTTATWTTTANAVPLSTWFFGVLNYRYLRARYVGATTTGDVNTLSVMVLPIVRAV